MARKPEPGEAVRAVSLEGVSDFMRQLAHDLHNDLNALDLAATYISEIVEDVSAKEELATQRVTIHGMSKVLHRLSGRLQTPRPSKMSIPAAYLVGEFRERLARKHPADMSALLWKAEVGESQVDVDFDMVCIALGELFDNARLNCKPGGAVSFCASVTGDRLRLGFSQPTDAPAETTSRLGKDPFVVVQRRSYGLGLFYAARVAEVHGGSLRTRHDAERGLFIAEMELPLSKPVGSAEKIQG